ncbi:DNA replication initiation control protein YabA [Floricoccus tropicus]|uniref:Replication initiation control protein YabA n=2 Tax=Floricoccus TaxID=1930830 RepID=A0A1E8GMK8_9LACT|nr:MULTISPECIES: DNA replication initiation control protein YabA [Floricoccus]OFI47582.1 DNA replication initiation control protein YabA [Floricoccus penangensis]OFI49246.1 DNA replication initiation control protein YabA [Floricoccus tropicus]URZ87904.1 DNA replication initiation control protein YabA [Floricoccus penangensis]
MDKGDLFDKFDDLERVLSVTLADVNAIKKELQETIQENAILKVENSRLRDRLEELDNKEKTPISKSQLNLEKIYDEGFHICTMFYGQRRGPDESCAFCTELIYR